MGRPPLIVLFALILLMAPAFGADAASPAPMTSPGPATGPYPFPVPPLQGVPDPAPGHSPTPLPPPGLPPLTGETRKLTLRQAIDLALAANTSIKVAEAQEREAWYAWRSASAIPPATIALNGTSGSNTTPTNNGLNQEMYFVVQESLGPLGAVHLNATAARQAYRGAQAATAAARITAVQNVKDAFYGLLSAQAQVQVAEDNLKLANDIYRGAQKRFKLGAGPRMDLVNALIQQSSAEQTLVSAQGTLHQAQATLAPLLGLSAAQSLEASGAFELPSMSAEFSTLLAVAERLHPQIFQAAEAEKQQETQVAIARNQFSPTPSMFYNYDVTNITQTPLYLFGLSLSIPIDFGQMRNQVAQQVAAVQEKQYALQAAQLSVASSVKGSWDAYQAAMTNASVYKTKVLDPSEQLLTMTRYGFNEGAVPYLNVLNAEQTLRQARLQYLTLLQSGHQALDALEAAVGQSLEGAQP